MYLKFFGLNESPFSIPPDPQYLYLSHSHQEALAHLQYGLAEGGGFVQLTGEVGTGKTTLIRALGEKLPEHVDVALILFPVLTVAEFVAAICDELRIPHSGVKASIKVLIDALNSHLLQSHAKGRRTVLIIDEAQNLSREVLEQVRLLTNLETTKHKLLQIILIGQPELANLLSQQDLRQLAQRVTARYRLTALTREEACDYITHRCRVAGAKNVLFTNMAMHQIHSLSRGIPRLINVICDRALLGAYGRGMTTVDIGMVRRAAAEVGTGTKRWPHEGWSLRWLAPVAMLATLVALMLWQLPILQNLLRSETGETQAATLVAKTSDTATVTALPLLGKIPVASDPASVNTLETMLMNPDFQADTESALKGLFSHWGLDYAALAGDTGCERGLSAGLRCLYKTGGWNDLRTYNRPAVIELQDKQNHRHHVLVAALKGDVVSLEMANRKQDVSLREVDRLWVGKFLMLWKPAAPAGEIMRRGMRGESILWLRDALMRARGATFVPQANDVFDQDLETQVMEFQSSHRLDPDGVVGAITLALLMPYDIDKPPSLLPEAELAAAR